jgi:S-DNA-T family DNA segregation ATPase FtsK/SpoIIIE
MKTTARPKPSKKRQQPDLSQRPYDVLGITTFSLALICASSLLFANSGVVGGAMSAAVRGLFGKGSWLVPPMFVVLSIAFFKGRKKLEVSHLTLGLVLVLISILGFLAGNRNGDYFDVAVVSHTGGLTGAAMAWLMDKAFGAAKPIGLATIGLIGVVFAIPHSVQHLMSKLKGTARTAAEKAKETLQEVPNRAVVVAHPEEEVPRRKERYSDTVAAQEQPVLTERSKPKRIERLINETSTLPAEPLPPAEGYQLPPLTLLAEPPQKAKRSPQEMEQNIETLESTLEEFGIEANVVEVANGPTITRYEIQLGPGIRVGRITSLADNVAMNLAASHVRVEAPIPGKAAIGVEVPNAVRTPVTLREVLDTKEFMEHPSRLVVGLGQDVSGVNRYADLTVMPHLLIGGATNSGKSIGLASVIMSLLMRNTPKDVKFVMIDPKRVELTLFDGIPHLMCPVIKDVKEAPGVLRAVWREMDRRYDLLSEHGCRNIDGWNAQASFQDRMPYIVVIIDELADLMIQAKAEVETSIVRIAQLARAVGIHLVIATQRPSVDVITGTIKANIPSRIAFSVSSQIDSRTILDTKGAEDLIGRGDMLFQPIDASKPVRIQGCYVSEKEVAAVCKFWREQEKPAYILQPLIEASSEGGGRIGGGESSGDEDPLWPEAVQWVADRGQASTSMMQRRFSIGFQRASRLLDMMEERGIVGPRDGSRPREVLISPEDVDVMLGRNAVPKNYGIRQELLEEEEQTSDWDREVEEGEPDYYRP